MEQTINTFGLGLNTDLNPLVTPNDVMTNCLNGTLVTYNGNEMVLLNDMGNGKVETAALWDGYVPIGMKQHGGIIYVASYNPETLRSLIGCFPSPERNIEDLLTPTNIPDLDLGNKKIPLFEKGMLHAGDKYLAFLPTSLNYDDITPSFANEVGDPFTDRKSRYSITMCVLNNDGELVDITSTCKPHEYDGKYYWFNVRDEAPSVINYNICHGKPAGKPYLNCIENLVISMDASLFVFKHPSDGNIRFRPDVTMVYNCPAYTKNGSKGLRGFNVKISLLEDPNGNWIDTESAFFEIKNCPESNVDNNFTLRYYNKDSYKALSANYNTKGAKIKFLITPVFNYGGGDYLQDNMSIEITMDVDKIGDNTTTLNTWKSTYEDDAVVVTYGFESYISNEDFLPQDMYIRFHKPTLAGSGDNQHYTFSVDNLNKLTLEELLEGKLEADDVDYAQFVPTRSSYNGIFSEYIDQKDLLPNTFYIIELGYKAIDPEDSQAYKLYKNFKFVITTPLYNQEYLSNLDISKAEPKVKVSPIVSCNLKTKLLDNKIELNSVETVSVTEPSVKNGNLTIKDIYEYSIIPEYEVKENPLYPVLVKLSEPKLKIPEDKLTDDHEGFEGKVVFSFDEEEIYKLTYTISLDAEYSYKQTGVNISKCFETYEARDLVPLLIGGGLVKLFTIAHDDTGSRDDYYLKYYSFDCNNVEKIKEKIIWEECTYDNLMDESLSNLSSEIDTACESTASNTPLAVRVAFTDIYLVDVETLGYFRNGLGRWSKDGMHHRPDVWYYATNWLVYNGETYILLNSAMDPKGRIPDNYGHSTPFSASLFGENPYSKEGILKNYAVCTDQNITKELWLLNIDSKTTESEEFNYEPALEVDGKFVVTYKDILWDIADFKAEIEEISDTTIKSLLKDILNFADFNVDDNTIQIIYSQANLLIQKTGTATFKELISEGKVPTLLIYGNDKKMVFPEIEMDEETVYKVFTDKDGNLKINSTDRLLRAKKNGMYHAFFLTYTTSSTSMEGISDKYDVKKMYYGHVTYPTEADFLYIAIPDLENDYRLMDNMGLDLYTVKDITIDPKIVTIPVFYNSVAGETGRMVIEASYASAGIDLLEEFKS